MRTIQKLNIVFWLSLAAVLMTCAYFKWEDYNLMSFFSSLVIHGGFCALCAYMVNQHIPKKPKYKTFNDLVFVPWTNEESYSDEYKDTEEAKMEFENGYGISVICGEPFYSNGVNTYEVKTMKNGEYKALKPWDTDVFPYKTRDEITNIMKHLQTLK